MSLDIMHGGIAEYQERIGNELFIRLQIRQKAIGKIYIMAEDFLKIATCS